MSLPRTAPRRSVVATAVGVLISFVGCTASVPSPIEFCDQTFAPEARVVVCDSVLVTDLAPLAALTRLEELDLTGTRVADLRPVASLRFLTYLYASGTPIADLRPLRALPLMAVVHLNDTRVADLGPLAGLPKLRWLEVRGTAVADLAPLRGLANLAILRVQQTRVHDLAPIAALPSLTELQLTAPPGDTALARQLEQLARARPGLAINPPALSEPEPAGE